MFTADNVLKFLVIIFLEKISCHALSSLKKLKKNQNVVCCSYHLMGALRITYAFLTSSVRSSE